MPVYVDPLQEYDSGKWCHMIADTPSELHAMAARLGLQRKWAQTSSSGVLHYDLRPSKRRLAVHLGVNEISSQELVKIGKAARDF